MTAYNIVSEIVSKVIRNSPDLPADYRDADASTRSRVERMAEEQGTTPARVWEVIRAQHTKDKSDANGEGFNPEEIAKASRR